MSFLLTGVLIVTFVASFAAMLALYLLERDKKRLIAIRVSKR
jgi:hypothetical protein